METVKKHTADTSDGEFDTTRCGDCGSDEIFAFESDDGGGLCTKCKLLILGAIRGGISKMEMRRRRGEVILPEEVAKPVVNVPAKAPEKVGEPLPRAIQAAIDARSGANPAIKALERSTAPVAKAPEVPKGPGFIKKVVGVIRDFQKEMKATVPAVEAPKTVAPVVPASASAPIKKLENTAFKPPVPRVGERWAIGPCIMCRINKKQDGTVTVQPTGERSRYVWLFSSVDSRLLYGCILCAKKF